MMLATILAVFVLVHSPGGSDIALNSAEISSIRQRAEMPDQHEDVRCVIVMTNGLSIGVIETCPDVIRALVAAEKKQEASSAVNTSGTRGLWWIRAAATVACRASRAVSAASVGAKPAGRKK